MSDNTYIDQLSYGFSQPYESYQPKAVRFARAPTSTDKRYPYSQIWIDTSTNDIYMLTNVVAGAANWELLVSGEGDISVTGDISTSGGNISITGAGKQLRVEGGAATDFIGTATLASGEVTVANTNIAASDRIFIQRQSAGSSTALGELTYTISAGASFTITSKDLSTPANTVTGDVSVVSYFIVRQL